jgi:hypothetical protein
MTTMWNHCYCEVCCSVDSFVPCNRSSQATNEEFSVLFDFLARGDREWTSSDNFVKQSVAAESLSGALRRKWFVKHCFGADCEVATWQVYSNTVWRCRLPVVHVLDILQPIVGHGHSINDQRSWVAPLSVLCPPVIAYRTRQETLKGFSWNFMSENFMKNGKLLHFWLKKREIMPTLREHMSGFLYLLFAIRVCHGPVYLFIFDCLCETGPDELYVLWTVHRDTYTVNPSNVELNPICHLLSLFWAHHILHVST